MDDMNAAQQEADLAIENAQELRRQTRQLADQWRSINLTFSAGSFIAAPVKRDRNRRQQSPDAQ